MIAVYCAQCGARNRIRGRSHARHPICGKCNTPLPPSTRWLRIPADLRSSVFAHGPAVGLAALGLLLGVATTGGLLYPSIASVHPSNDATVSPARPAAVKPARIMPALQAVRFSPGDEQIYVEGPRRAPLAITTPAGPLHYYVRLEDAQTGRLVMTVLLDGGQPFRTRVPLGSYRVVYAVGATWYGPQELFGPHTRRFQLDRTFAFSKRHGSYRGARLALGQPQSVGERAAVAVPAIELQLPRDPPALDVPAGPSSR